MVTKDGQPAENQPPQRRRYASKPSSGSKPRRRRSAQQSTAQKPPSKRTRRKAPERPANAQQQQAVAPQQTPESKPAPAPTPAPRKQKTDASDAVPQIKSHGIVTQNRQLSAVVIAAVLFMVGGYLWSIRRDPETKSITQQLEVDEHAFDDLLQFVDDAKPEEADGAPVEQQNMDNNAFAQTDATESAAYGDSGFETNSGIPTQTVSSSQSFGTTGPALGDPTGVSTGPAFGHAPTTPDRPQFGSLLDEPAGGNPFEAETATTEPAATSGGPTFGLPPAADNSNPFADATPTTGAAPTVPQPPAAQFGSHTTSNTSDGPVIVPGAFHNN